MIGHLKRAMRKKQRLTVEEFSQRLQLSEAIVDYGRMIQAFYHRSAPEVIVEIPEMACRFRETPRTIKDALRLLRDMGRAEPADLDGCWKLQLAPTLPSGREGLSLGDASLPHLGKKTNEIYCGQKDLQQH